MKCPRRLLISRIACKFWEGRSRPDFCSRYWLSADLWCHLCSVPFPSCYRSWDNVVTLSGDPCHVYIPSRSFLRVRTVSRIAVYLIAFSTLLREKIVSRTRQESVWSSACSRVGLPGDRILGITAVARFWGSFAIYIRKALFLSCSWRSGLYHITSTKVTSGHFSCSRRPSGK